MSTTAEEDPEETSDAVRPECSLYAPARLNNKQNDELPSYIGAGSQWMAVGDSSIHRIVFLQTSGSVITGNIFFHTNHQEAVYFDAVALDPSRQQLFDNGWTSFFQATKDKLFLRIKTISGDRFFVCISHPALIRDRCHRRHSMPSEGRDAQHLRLSRANSDSGKVITYAAILSGSPSALPAQKPARDEVEDNVYSTIFPNAASLTITKRSKKIVTTRQTAVSSTEVYPDTIGQLLDQTAIYDGFMARAVITGYKYEPSSGPFLPFRLRYLGAGCTSGHGQYARDTSNSYSVV